MRSFCGWDLAEWLERLTANAPVATVLGSIPASVGKVESEGRQMKQCWILYKQKEKNPPKKYVKKRRKKRRKVPVKPNVARAVPYHILGVGRREFNTFCWMQI